MIQICHNSYPLSGLAGFFPPEPVIDTSSRSDSNIVETAHNLPEKQHHHYKLEQHTTSL